MVLAAMRGQRNSCNALGSRHCGEIEKTIWHSVVCYVRSTARDVFRSRKETGRGSVVRGIAELPNMKLKRTIRYPQGHVSFRSVTISAFELACDLLSKFESYVQ